MFSTLLRILLRELEQVLAEDNELGSTPMPQDVSERIGATARRTLPCLRHYSGWLILNAAHLVVLENYDHVSVQITEFWQVYAETLTLLASKFDTSVFPDVDYMLEEDEDTITFAPFTNLSTSKRHSQAAGRTLRPRSCDQAVQRRDPSVEMLYRIRGLVEDGIEIAAKEVGLSYLSSGGELTH